MIEEDNKRLNEENINILDEFAKNFRTYKNYLEKMIMKIHMKMLLKNKLKIRKSVF